MTVALLGSLGFLGIVHFSEVRENREKLLDVEYRLTRASNWRGPSERRSVHYSYNETLLFLRLLQLPIGICLSLASVASLAIWTSRNLRALTQVDPSLAKFPPRWAALSWFIPLYQLVYPFQVIRGLWNSVDRIRPPRRKNSELNSLGMALAWSYQGAALWGFGFSLLAIVYATFSLPADFHVRVDSGLPAIRSGITHLSLVLSEHAGLIAMCFLALANVAGLSRRIQDCVEGGFDPPQRCRLSIDSFEQLEQTLRNWKSFRDPSDYAAAEIATLSLACIENMRSHFSAVDRARFVASFASEDREFLELLLAGLKDSQ